MLTSALLLSALAAGGAAPDFAADAWWNSVPLTIEQLRGHAVFIEAFRTW